MKITLNEDSADHNGLKALAEACLDNYSLPMDKISSRAANKDFTILFALAGKKRIGFITGYGEGGKMHIWLFGVLNGQRGKGIGAKLLQKFHSVALKKGYKTVNTITFNKYPQKIVLSVKSGYKITGTKFIPEKNDTAIMLEKELQ